jgi:hypothetical protein
MKRIFCFIVFLITLIGDGIIFAQENDDFPYLSDEDIAAIELILPEDIPGISAENTKKLEDNAEKGNETNEMSRLNTSRSIYHLLILDRTKCPANSDIGDTGNVSILYKFKHRTNGYLIALYKSSTEGPVFPILPKGSLILVDLVTVRKNTITEYINSSAFKKFVTSRRILSQMRNILKTDI